MTSFQQRLFFVSVILLSSHFSFCQSWIEIPATSVNLYQLWDVEQEGPDTLFPAFEISSQILFKEYKEFLNEIKRDSSKEYYKKHIPDSTICLYRRDYEEYLTNKAFNNSPVAGISWEAAINYCAWKTLKDNRNKNLEFYYRLPYRTEWLVANENNPKLTVDFSDWTMTAFDESSISRHITFIGFDWYYLHKQNDPPVLKRKHYVGRNFIYHHNFFYGHYGYANKGYRNISFRLIKVYNTDQKMTQENLLRY